MKQTKINVLNMLTADYPQFKSKSLAFDAVAQVLDIPLSKAKELVATHCNLLSFWLILRSSEQYDRGYAQFFKWMLENNFCNIKGYFLIDKEIILDKLGIESTLERYKEYEDILDPIRLNPDKFYQIKIKGDTSGDHFMACYIQNGVLYGSDTSYRGTPFILSDKVTLKNFQWIQETC